MKNVQHDCKSSAFCLLFSVSLPSLFPLLFCVRRFLYMFNVELRNQVTSTLKRQLSLTFSKANMYNVNMVMWLVVSQHSDSQMASCQSFSPFSAPRNWFLEKQSCWNCQMHHNNFQGVMDSKWACADKQAVMKTDKFISIFMNSTCTFEKRSLQNSETHFPLSLLNGCLRSWTSQLLSFHGISLVMFGTGQQQNFVMLCEMVHQISLHGWEPK